MAGRSTTLTVAVVTPRMLSASDAAAYVGVPRARLAKVCPVQMVELAPGTRVYDRDDLDAWIDTIKSGGAADTLDSILGRLK